MSSVFRLPEAIAFWWVKSRFPGGRRKLAWLLRRVFLYYYGDLTGRMEAFGVTRPSPARPKPADLRSKNSLLQQPAARSHSRRLTGSHARNPPGFRSLHGTLSFPTSPFLPPNSRPEVAPWRTRGAAPGRTTDVSRSRQACAFPRLRSQRRQVGRAKREPTTHDAQQSDRGVTSPRAHKEVQSNRSHEDEVSHRPLTRHGQRPGARHSSGCYQIPANLMEVWHCEW